MPAEKSSLTECGCGHLDPSRLEGEYEGARAEAVGARVLRLALRCILRRRSILQVKSYYSVVPSVRLTDPSTEPPRTNSDRPLLSLIPRGKHHSRRGRCAARSGGGSRARSGQSSTRGEWEGEKGKGRESGRAAGRRSRMRR